MVEFRFDIRPLFAQPIVKVTSNLLPHTFRGDRRQALDATSKMSEIIDRLGQLSATSQKLNKPVTTAQKLRMSDNQILYLLGDVEAGNNGSVIGLLKVGTKDLYLFDETGQTRKIENTPCILDFYIHESRQRAGLGKDMFETMLGEEHWTPLKCSVDRPSEKLLGFLKKHYGLVRTIPQANNFVLYEGFFDRADNGAKTNLQQTNGMHITTSPNTQLFGAHYVGDESHKRRMRQQDAPNAAAQITQISPVGRYGARRPTCSMAEKTGSEVSLSPSQAAEQAKINARKNPLDALSRMSIRHQTIEKRSGLQDVDDDYMRNNIFARSNFPRHSGLNDDYGMNGQMRNNMNAANAAAQQPLIPTESSFKLKTSADGGAGETAQMQMQQAQAQAHAQQQSQMQSQMHAAHQQQPQMQSQMQPQMHAHPQQMQQMQHTHAQQPQMQCKNQTFNANQANATPQAAMASNEPEMCTTCPNCQTTIYLVRSNEGNHEHGMQIIHSNSTPKKAGPESSSLTSPISIVPVVEALATDLQDLHTNDLDEATSIAEAADLAAEAAEMAVTAPQMEAAIGQQIEISSPRDEQSQRTGSVAETSSGDNFMNMKKPATFQLSKQHTGMKNMSFGVGMAVTPTNKMEFDQEAREDFGVVKINRPIGSKLNSPSAPDHTDAISTVSSGEGLTDQGYYDLKFYHNKLW